MRVCLGGSQSRLPDVGTGVAQHSRLADKTNNSLGLKGLSTQALDSFVNHCNHNYIFSISLHFSYLSIIICLHTVIRFQIFPSNANNLYTIKPNLIHISTDHVVCLWFSCVLVLVAVDAQHSHLADKTNNFLDLRREEGRASSHPGSWFLCECLTVIITIFSIFHCIFFLFVYNHLWLVGCLGFNNLCRLFNTKCIFIQIISSISNNLVEHEYKV